VPEVEVTTDWADSETIRTREQMRVLGGEGEPAGYAKTTAEGEISYGEFSVEVRDPVKAQIHADFDDVGRAAQLHTERWFTVATGGIPPLILASYHSSMTIDSSVSHLHDFDPRAKLDELSLELRTAKVAELNDLYGTSWLPGDIVLDWDFADVDFPLVTYPIGEYGNRLIEVRHSKVAESEEPDGDPGIEEPGADALAFWAIPVQEPGSADPDPTGRLRHLGVHRTRGPGLRGLPFRLRVHRRGPTHRERHPRPGRRRRRGCDPGGH
jgi:hypothetical protein